MASNQIRAMMEELHCTATDIDADGLARLHKVCIMIETMTAEQCRNLVRKAGRRPCLAVFMSDGRSCDILQKFRAVADEVVVIAPAGFALNSSSKDP